MLLLLFEAWYFPLGFLEALALVSVREILRCERGLWDQTCPRAADADRLFRDAEWPS